jgi:hypothetical protein
MNQRPQVHVTTILDARVSASEQTLSGTGPITPGRWLHLGASLDRPSIG